MPKKNKVLYIVSIIFVFLFFLIFTLAKDIDHDTLHYLIYGKDIFENGIPYYNIHNIEPGLKIILQEWLFDLGIYTLYKYLGWIGIIIYDIILFSCLYFFIFKEISNHIDNKTYAFLANFLIFLIIGIFFNERIHWLSILFILIQNKYINKNNWVFSLLLLLEINLHGSFWVFHYIYAIPYLLLIDNKRIVVNKNILYQMLYSLPLLFINPYGLDMILYPFKTIGSETMSMGIQELQSWKVNSFGGIMLFISIILFIIAFKKLSFLEISMFIITFIPSMLYKRMLFFLPIGLFYILINEKVYLSAKNLFTEVYRKVYNNIVDIISIFNIILVFTSILLLSINVYLGIKKIDSYKAPINTISYLEENNIEEVFTTFNTGTDLEWAGYKVYIDSCPEVFTKAINKKKDILNEYSKYNEQSFNLLNNYQYIFTDQSDIKAEFKYRTDWEKVVEDDNMILYRNLNWRVDEDTRSN